MDFSMECLELVYGTLDGCVDPTQSMDRRDLFLNGRKMWVDFRILKNPSSRRTVFLWSHHLLFVVIL